MLIDNTTSKAANMSVVQSTGHYNALPRNCPKASSGSWEGRGANFTT